MSDPGQKNYFWTSKYWSGGSSTIPGSCHVFVTLGSSYCLHLLFIFSLISWFSKIISFSSNVGKSRFFFMWWTTLGLGALQSQWQLFQATVVNKKAATSIMKKQVSIVCSSKTLWALSVNFIYFHIPQNTINLLTFFTIVVNWTYICDLLPKLYAEILSPNVMNEEVGPFGGD
jgi:hypothetical protein